MLLLPQLQLPAAAFVCTVSSVYDVRSLLMIGLIGLIANDYHHSELHRNGAAQQQQHTKQNEVVLLAAAAVW